MRFQKNFFMKEKKQMNGDQWREGFFFQLLYLNINS